MDFFREKPFSWKSNRYRTKYVSQVYKLYGDFQDENQKDQGIDPNGDARADTICDLVEKKRHTGRS